MCEGNHLYAATQPWDDSFIDVWDANSAVKIPPFSSRLGDIEMSLPSLSGFWNRGSKDKLK